MRLPGRIFGPLIWPLKSVGVGRTTPHEDDGGSLYKIYTILERDLSAAPPPPDLRLPWPWAPHLSLDPRAAPRPLAEALLHPSGLPPFLPDVPRTKELVPWNLKWQGPPFV